tara:strand:- start:706 stop:1443 length:738 start_codon:yes stop_codon:yes gene_type:complete
MINIENKNIFSSATVAIIGASGGIGSTISKQIRTLDRKNTVIEIVRSKSKKSQFEMDMLNEDSVANCANEIRNKFGSIDVVLNTTGLLHTKKHSPERTYKEIDLDYLQEVFQVNTFIPFLISKYFAPLLTKDSASIIAFMSARLGSISDNKLGGWYSYRSSKTALNMLIKSLSIELSYSNKNAICIGLHPGTVDTQLSRPFTQKFKNKRVFTKEEAVEFLISALNSIDHKDTGNIIDWHGKTIPY